MYEEDYIKRMIKSIGQMLVAIVKGKNAIENNMNEDNYDVIISEDGLLEIMIKKYISDGKINEAENMLFKAISSHKSTKNLELALFFYDEINKLDKDKLERYNFSKQGIVEGLKEVKKLYNTEI